MRTEPVTDEMIAESRTLAKLEPHTGRPALARCLIRFGRQINRDRPLERIPYFEEAADIYRGLAEDGTEVHLLAAARTIASLGLTCSLAHADDAALAAKHEAATFARLVNRQRVEGRAETRVLMDLAHGLAEAGQFAAAVTVQLEIVEAYRAAGSADGRILPDNFAWSLLDLAIFLDLAGRIDASLDVDEEAVTFQRRITELEPWRVPGLTIWTAGAALRFAATGHPRRSRELLSEAVAACDRLPAEGSPANFGFRQALGASHFARSGTQDERPAGDQGIPVGVEPDHALQHVPGMSFDHWSFSVRETYQAGLDAIDNAIAANADPTSHDTSQAIELGTLMRRSAIRNAVMCAGPRHFSEKIVPALAACVAFEGRVAATDSRHGSDRLSRALIDQAIGYLVLGSNARAGGALQEAYDLL